MTAASNKAASVVLVFICFVPVVEERPARVPSIHGRAMLRRDITNAKQAGSGRPGVVRYTHTDKPHLLPISRVRWKN